MTPKYILQTIDTIESKRVEILAEISSINTQIDAGMANNSNFFASDRHVELHNRKKDLLDVYEDLSAAFITISKLF